MRGAVLVAVPRAVVEGSVAGDIFALGVSHAEMANNIAAPEPRRRVTKLAASTEPSPNAIRVSNELAAKAIKVRIVSSVVCKGSWWG